MPSGRGALLPLYDPAQGPEQALKEVIRWFAERLDGSPHLGWASRVRGYCSGRDDPEHVDDTGRLVSASALDRDTARDLISQCDGLQPGELDSRA
jgi:hypothetical protein